MSYPQERKAREDFSLKMQKVAIAQRYPAIFPHYKIIEIDEMAHTDALAKVIDISGCDKALVARDGHIVWLGQRFRQHDQWDQYHDFTIRESEYRRHLKAIQNGGSLPGFYVYGYANQGQDDFLAFLILKYRQFFQDIRDGRWEMQFKETHKTVQENFYWNAFEELPSVYVVHLQTNIPIQKNFLEVLL
jgi:hypothetical protein